MTKSRTTEEARLPGAFAGETVTRRRLMSGTAHVAGAVAVAAAGLPAIGFALGPAFERPPTTWQSVGPAADFNTSTYVPRVIRLTTDPVGEAALTTIFVRKRDAEIDTEPADEWNRFIALTSRCAHVGCPVGYKDAARTFVCPCHGGVYDFRGVRTGGPPPRPLDRFFTRVRAGQLEIGPRYSVDSKLDRYAPRDPGEALDGIGKYVYPPRFTTPTFPSR